MRENKRLFNQLRSEYPNGLSKEQFYKIAHISKATARYLLQSGKVPCKDTGKKTRCYLIQVEDVIFYLQDREAHPDKYLAIDGWYSANSKVRKDFISYRQELRRISKKQVKKLKEHIETQTDEVGDLLNIKMISKVTGYSCSSICRWCESGRLRSFRISGAYNVPKEWLVEFLISEYASEIVRKSKRHLEMIREFLAKENC